MGQAIPRQHPAVVLRSSYRQLRALLALALVLVAGLSVALVVVASDDESTTTTAKPVQSIRYGDFNPQTGRPITQAAAPDAATAAKPDESKIAASIWRAQQAKGQSGPGGPDESSVAAAIAGR